MDWTPSTFSGVTAVLGTVTVSVFQALVVRLPILYKLFLPFVCTRPMCSHGTAMILSLSRM